MPAPGSIAFTGFNVDSPNGTGGDDNIAFVALEGFASGSVIYFQDNEWNGTAFTSGEGLITWTATSAIAAGTVVTIDNLASGVIASNLGTAVRTGAFNLSGTDEQIYAFQGTSGTAPTVFLTALANNLFTSASASATLAGTGLTDGVNAISFGNNIDIGAFSGARDTAVSFAEYAATVNTVANWQTEDGANSQANNGTAPDTPFSTAAFTVAPPPPSGPVILAEAESLAGSSEAPVGTGTIDLERVSSIGGTAPDGDTTPAGRAESVSYDARNARAYVTNADASTIDVIQVGADGSLTLVESIALAGLPSYGAVNSVAVKNGVIAVAYQNANAQADGFVALFDTVAGTQTVLTVGALPDQLTFTPDGTRILVANEGEPAIPASPGVINDPQGSVSIIDLSGGAASATVSQTIDFTSLNGLAQELRDQGTPLGVPGSSVAQNAEPEYITVSADGTRAYVTLQEMNAVAVLDLTNTTTTDPIAILPLGGVDRNLVGNEFDPSDRDGIDLGNFNVKSLLMPDAIASFDIGGTTYFITANEGDARDYPGFVDEIRAGNAAYNLDDGIYPDEATLKGQNELGRLNVLRFEGDTDNDGDIDQITTYGGRGISIFQQNADGTIVKVRETGGEMEAIFARDFPAFFNTENGATVDTRSDNKGPEPEGVTVGVVNGRTYAFVGLERVGAVMIYDVTDPANAVYVGYKTVRDGDYAPEVVTFVSAEDSPTGQAFVLSANEVSGTLTLFSVRQNFNGTGDEDLLVGSAEDDVLRGFGAGDRLRGLAGDDRLFGDDGDDILEGGEGADTIFGGDGIDTITFINATEGVAVNLQARSGSAGEADGDTYVQIENIDGSDFDDVLTGDTGANMIMGNDGDDIINGLGGADVLNGGDGNDVFLVSSNSEYVLIDGGRDYDTVRADVNGAILNVTALANIEAIDLNGFTDVELRGSGTIDASGFDLLFSGGENALTIRGFNGTDTITGTDGDDIIFGGNGRDVINGGAGDDVIDGGAKQDTLIGGDGADRFLFANATETAASFRKADNITDFDAAEGDLIDFSALGATSWAGFNGLTGVEGQVSWYLKNGSAFVGGDLDGDRVYDFLVKLDGVISLDQASVIL